MEEPIGYWLKHLDGLIEATFDHALAEDRLARRHWQAMNTLKVAPESASGLAEALAPFWSEGAITVDEVIDGLSGRGWIVQGGDGRYALTPAGEAAHASVNQRVRAVRRRVLDGLTPGEYAETVRVLRRMSENLEAVLA